MLGQAGAGDEPRTFTPIKSKRPTDSQALYRHMNSQPIGLHVIDEVSELKTVVLGIATSLGEPRPINLKAAEAIRNGTYPTEPELSIELEGFANQLTSAGVTVLRPKNIPNLNQI